MQYAVSWAVAPSKAFQPSSESFTADAFPSEQPQDQHSLGWLERLSFLFVKAQRLWEFSIVLLQSAANFRDRLPVATLSFDLMPASTAVFVAVVTIATASVGTVELVVLAGVATSNQE